MKKRVALLLMAVLIAGILAGCGSASTTSSSSPAASSSQAASSSSKVSSSAASTTSASSASSAADKPVELTFWSLAARTEFEDKIIADFEAAHPNIKITATYQSTDDIKANLKISAASNTLPSMWYNWGGTLASYFPENGLSYDLAEYAKKNNWSSKYLAPALELCTLDNQLCGMPQSLAGMTVWYRTDIFKKCGIEIPTTFDQFEAALATLKQNGYTPLATGGQNGWHVMRYIQDLIEYYAGADEHDSLSLMNSDWSKSEAVKHGEMTLCRFDGDNGEYSLLLGRAKGIDGPYTKGTYVWVEVQNLKRLEAKLVEGPYIHHCVGIHADVVPVLYEACKYIKVKPDFYDPIEEDVKAYLRGE